ncbi:MAG TPA: prolyl oligopeptidase family serine peptidase [Rudaea sp.]|nr:prolyl oligopeptidase family serine peptidase [Rudaea sp.]
MIRLALAAPLALLTFTTALAQPAPPAQAPLTSAPLKLEQIMADPDWIAGQIQVPGEFEEGGGAPYFSVDGKSIYYKLKRSGSPVFDLHRIDLAENKDSLVDATAMADADGSHTVYDAGNTHAAFVRNGEVFLRDLRSGATAQMTRDGQRHGDLQFSADGRLLSFHSGDDWFVHDLASGTTAPAAVLKTENDPDAAPKDDVLRAEQLRLFTTLQKMDKDKKESREHAQAMQRGDASRAPLPFWLGDKVKLVDTELSPDARWLLAVTVPKDYERGEQAKLIRYVTDTGYPEFESLRRDAGRNPPPPQTLWLFDLAKHTQAKIDVDGLPGIHDDPLAAVRAENEKAGLLKAPATEKADARRSKRGRADKSAKSKKTRDLEIAGIEFSRDGAHAAVQLRAIDNKDRWLVTLDPSHLQLALQQRLHDDAWINWNFNEFGWESDSRTLWYVSEESGYAQLYAKPIDGKARQLTHGKFEVSRPQLSTDGRWFYVRANAEQPWAYDVYRIGIDGGELHRITHYRGLDMFALSHYGSKLLIAHSTPYIPPQLAVVNADGSGNPHELTDTRTAQYKALDWTAPQYVQVPSTHFKGSIWAKFYAPADYDKSKPHPAVIFVHGAGYLQDVTANWSYYFREQMFANLLLQHGYIVIDMDYRASEGYGRAWRTAIYRDMGHPELEDLLDGKAWMVKNWNADPKRVGIYGGSYGGYMTLMALFRAPGEFAAGAALRPVSDWMLYDDGYTSDILNRPQDDPMAYRRSSPIEFAANLRDPLLVCHGVIDNNVMFQDTARLYERLIELHKDNFNLSIYPLDRHGFVNADSWLDEYKRIYKLFEANLK